MSLPISDAGVMARLQLYESRRFDCDAIGSAAAGLLLRIEEDETRRRWRLGKVDGHSIEQQTAFSRQEKSDPANFNRSFALSWRSLDTELSAHPRTPAG